MNISENAEKLINILNENGFKAYVVGGCVRDYLLGKDAGDIDITTSAAPQQVESILQSENIKVVETGIKHGTVTAVLNGKPYEITTFRKDGDYKDSRRPETVDFVTPTCSAIKSFVTPVFCLYSFNISFSSIVFPLNSL